MNPLPSLRDHPVHLDNPSLIAFRHSFADCDKLMYRGEADDDTGFRFNCFNIEDAHDPEVGLERGELVIPGSVLRRDVFDPVVGASPTALCGWSNSALTFPASRRGPHADPASACKAPLRPS